MRTIHFAGSPWFVVAVLVGCSGSPSSSVPPAPPQQDAWLSFKFQSGVGTPGCGSYQHCTAMSDNAAKAEAVAYYNALGIANVATYTLDNWLQDNGFKNPAAQIGHAIYFNKLDLQFGRDMYCVQNGQNVACYVVNYGPPPFASGAENPAWPNLTQALTDAANRANPFATVAMTFNPNDANNKVSFYVFDNAGAANPIDFTTVHLSTTAALDGEGPKTVPRMCMSCHGGAYDTATHSVPAPAAFLPFDVVSFGLGAADGGLAFLNLNAFVLATRPPQAIVDFINGTYASYPNGIGAPFSQTQVGTVVDFVPAAWKTAPRFGNVDPGTLYGSVVRNYCRMCHLAQAQDFSTFDKFKNEASQIDNFVCNIADMPHMEVPFGSQVNALLKQGGIGFWLDVDPTPRKDLRDFLIAAGLNNTKCPDH